MPFVADDVLAITAIGGLVLSAVSTAYNAWSTHNTNRENQNWTEDQNNLAYERSTQSLQTKVADAKKAGLSPLAALGSSGTQITTPLQYAAQAPQMDFSQLMSSMTSLSNEYSSDETKKKIAKLEAEVSVGNNIRSLLAERQLRYMEAANNLKMCRENIASNQSIAQGQLDESARQADMKMNLEFQRVQAQYQLQAQTQSYSIEKENQQRDIDTWSKSCDYTANFCNMFGIPFERRDYIIHNDSDYKRMCELNNASMAQLGTGFKNYTEWRNDPKRKPEDFAKMWSKASAEAKGENKGKGFSGSIGKQDIQKTNPNNLPATPDQLRQNGRDVLGNLLGDVLPSVSGSYDTSSGTYDSASDSSSRTASDLENKLQFGQMFVGDNGKIIMYVPRYQNKGFDQFKWQQSSDYGKRYSIR